MRSGPACRLGIRFFIFWLEGDMLFTPSLKTGCLPGTTREHILENIECREVEAGIEELDSADAIFLTSAGLGIVDTGRFESKEMAASRHDILSFWPPKDTKTRTHTKYGS